MAAKRHKRHEVGASEAAVDQASCSVPGRGMESEGGRGIACRRQAERGGDFTLRHIRS